VRAAPEKNLVAQGIHQESERRSGPMVPVNCASIPESLIESELFGHVKGAFTGADKDKKGLFDVAEGGTLFLDEIGDIPLALQPKLLRVLQEGEIRPVGGAVATTIEVRVIAATAKDLEVEMAAGHFREDLFYRLNVVPIKLPPLRERPEDIPQLCQYFINRFNESLGSSIKNIFCNGDGRAGSTRLAREYSGIGKCHRTGDRPFGRQYAGDGKFLIWNNGGVYSR
jgi:transcriptional regulator with GAF, ATPase, and Fis domain